MDRRTFLTVCTASGTMLLPGLGCFAGKTIDENVFRPPAIFPESPPVEHLHVAPLRGETLADRHLYTCLQGIVNRKETRIYFETDDTDAQWLAYYRERYGVSYSREATPEALLQRFASEIDGYIVHDPELPDTSNVALAMGSLQNALPVSPESADRLDAAGLRKLDDLRGRWTDRYECYRFALREVFPHCNKRLLGMVCVDAPHWPAGSLWVYDYYIANTILPVDLSACRRDRADRALLHEFYKAMEVPGCLLGWRSARNVEHDMVGYAARHGLYMLCGLHTVNLTVHAAVPKTTKPFVQRHVTPREVGPVKNKVYVAFMNTDGDALASMLRLQSGRFLEPEHGFIPYTWGFLPVAYDLMPGVAARNYELRAPNDYFVAPTCGAVYTYPYLLKNTREYLRYTRYCMERTGLRAAYMSNWDDNYWWQEMETPGFLEAMREELPGAIGFMRGMGESAFEPQILDGGAPYLFCGEGIHSGSDIYATLTDFVAANAIRPLFIFCLVNHGTTLARIKDAVDRLPHDEYEFVRLDALFHFIQKARERGMIDDDLYPDKDGLKVLLAKEARAAWSQTFARIVEHGEQASLSEEDYRKDSQDPMTRLILDRSATTPGDIVVFNAVWDSMHLVRLALNMKGIYVNNKAQGVRDFLETFGTQPDAGVVGELWEAWEQWEEKPVAYETARAWAQRLAALAQTLDAELGGG